jgi:hypothetical protein
MFNSSLTLFPIYAIFPLMVIIPYLVTLILYTTFEYFVKHINPGNPFQGELKEKSFDRNRKEQ